METAEYRDDGIWQVVPTRSNGLELVGSTEPNGRRRPWGIGGRGRGPALPAPRPRLIGWSLICVAVANLGFVAIVILAGMTPVALAACAALALSGWLLVVAELLSVRRLYGPADDGPDVDSPVRPQDLVPPIDR